MPEKYQVLIAGCGPAGIFTALELVKCGCSNILLLDKGSGLSNRLCPREESKIHCRRCAICSLLSGWGGAGAFSDGKLTLSPEVGGFLDEYLEREQLIELIEYVDGI